MPAADARWIQHLDKTAHHPAGVVRPARDLACEPPGSDDEEVAIRGPHLPSVRRYWSPMKFRRWERAGWSVAVGVPDRVAARLRHFAGARRGPLTGRLYDALAETQPGARVVNVDSL